MIWRARINSDEATTLTCKFWSWNWLAGRRPSTEPKSNELRCFRLFLRLRLTSSTILTTKEEEEADSYLALST